MPGDSPQVSEAEAQVLYWATGSTDSWSDVWHRDWPFCLAGQAVRRSTAATGLPRARVSPADAYPGCSAPVGVREGAL